MANVYIIKTKDEAAEPLGVAMRFGEADAYMTHPFVEGEDTTPEGVLKTLESVPPVPLNLIAAYAVPLDIVHQNYTNRSGGRPVVLDYIGVSEQ